jgi:hypothetical protein
MVFVRNKLVIWTEIMISFYFDFQKVSAQPPAKKIRPVKSKKKLNCLNFLFSDRINKMDRISHTKPKKS